MLNSKNDYEKALFKYPKSAPSRRVESEDRNFQKGQKDFKQRNSPTPKSKVNNFFTQTFKDYYKNRPFTPLKS